MKKKIKKLIQKLRIQNIKMISSSEFIIKSKEEENDESIKEKI